MIAADHRSGWRWLEDRTRPGQNLDGAKCSAGGLYLHASQALHCVQRPGSCDEWRSIDRAVRSIVRCRKIEGRFSGANCDAYTNCDRSVSDAIVVEEVLTLEHALRHRVDRLAHLLFRAI